MKVNVARMVSYKNKFLFCCLSIFFILYWLPWAINFICYFATFFMGHEREFIQYIWILESESIFLGHHYPAPAVIQANDTHLGYESLLACIILSIVISLIALLIDRKYSYLDRLQVLIYPYFYEMAAKLISLVMIVFAFAKIFPIQFFLGFRPENLMSATGSLSPWDLFWISYGSSQYYELVLGALEFIGAIFLWFPRTTIIGSVITTIVMVNIALMDLFLNVYIRAFTFLILATCIFLLWPEFRHYFQYFSVGKMEKRISPLHSIAKKFYRHQHRLICAVISALLFLSYALFFGIEAHRSITPTNQLIAHDPLYGVWDSTTRGVYLGEHSLETVGILRDSSIAKISLYSYHSPGIPEVITGKSDSSGIHFSLLNDARKKIAFTGKLMSQQLILSYAAQGKIITIHYRHRHIQSKRQAPKLVFEDP